MKREKFLKHLNIYGCYYVREAKGSHAVYANATNTATAIVPRHPIINIYTIESICKQLGIPKPKSK